jgi:hypothetical protein
LSNRTLSIDARVYDYLLSVSLEESGLLRELRAETACMQTLGDGLTLVCKPC